MQETENTYASLLNETSVNKNAFREQRIFHLAQINFRLSLFIFCTSLALIASGLLTFFLSAIVMLLGIGLILMTLGYILIVSPNFFEYLTNFTDGSSAVANFIFSLYAYIPFASAIGILTSIITLVSLKISKKQNIHKGMFVFSIVSIVLFSIITILTLFNVISMTKGATL